ncbi:hypothetical protein KOR42_17960 [Thalassoglobus neptunius]|uniref:Uncharacterized protein n=1 Tax=Thalassoglobus neptunius TaxID=1938619 RepID=A0A5C5X976_9PLAN|nr:hypothetical protein [Thalassoglobus neptunius]TWT58422.1 hypothetical protein KOR42_17960 [Thalassoglobus neptunius]
MDSNLLHRIRLKGPWEILPPEENLDDVPSSKQDQTWQRHAMPMDWRALFGESAGKAWFRRRFHRPSGLTSDECVQIYLPEGVGDVSDFHINQKPLQPASEEPIRFDVTAELEDFNELLFAITFDPTANRSLPGGLWETVFVEIHSKSS